VQSISTAPLVSFVLFTYNQEKFIEEAVKAALLQTYQPLEIIISDDASADRTFEIVKKLIEGYQGPHHVIGRVNAVNMGINPHINIGVKEAKGEFIVVAAGDDVSLPDRVKKLVMKWQSGVSGVFSNASIIDTIGNTKDIFVRPSYKHMADWHEMVLAGTHGAWGCTLSWEKKVFQIFGDMPENIVGEDAVIPFRCALLNGLAYVDEPLVQYRDHGENVSFWSQERVLRKSEMVKLGSHIMQYKEQMYNNWQSDIEFASSKELIDDQDCIWGTTVLNENILQVRKMNDLLRIPFIRLAYLLPYSVIYFSKRMNRVAPLIVSLKHTAWKFLNGVLHYRSPWLHKKIRQMLGRNT